MRKYTRDNWKPNDNLDQLISELLEQLKIILDKRELVSFIQFVAKNKLSEVILFKVVDNMSRRLVQGLKLYFSKMYLLFARTVGLV